MCKALQSLQRYSVSLGSEVLGLEDAHHAFRPVPLHIHPSNSLFIVFYFFFPLIHGFFSWVPSWKPYMITFSSCYSFVGFIWYHRLGKSYSKHARFSTLYATKTQKMCPAYCNFCSSFYHADQPSSRRCKILPESLYIDARMSPN
jgi:hypothetical protein